MLNCNHSDHGCVITMKSPPEEKVRLMSAMFYGRRDVFARRYERKDGRGGYAPVCPNDNASAIYDASFACLFRETPIDSSDG